MCIAVKKVRVSILPGWPSSVHRRSEVVRKRGREEQVEQRIFRAGKLASCVTAQWTHIRIYLSKPRGNPHENHGLWVMCECRFMNCNKCPLWLGC